MVNLFINGLFEPKNPNILTFFCISGPYGKYHSGCPVLYPNQHGALTDVSLFAILVDAISQDFID